MIGSALARAVAVALATLTLFGLVFLREATSPSGAGYWTAMAAAPGGNLYLADEGRQELRLVQPGGGSSRVGTLPRENYRALAADGPNLLLSTNLGLYQSSDSGLRWRRVLKGAFTTVSVLGAYEVAGAWADALYISDDQGASWVTAQVPPGDTEFLSLLPKHFAGTLLGLLRSQDGITWRPVAGIPDRVTALDFQGLQNVIRVGDWRGQVWLYDGSTGAVTRSASYPGGIEGMAGDLTATTVGIFPDHGGPLHGREVTRLLSTGAGGYFAAIAGGAVYSSPDGVRWTLAYQS